MEIPQILIDDIRSGNVVLFLGAGASFGAVHPEGSQIPLGRTLGNKIVNRFLDDSYLDNDLSYVGEIAISQKSLYEVQSFIKGVFEKYTPASHHLLLPTFNWKAIFTTNYDLLIENAYSQKKKEQDSLQNINPIYKNARHQDIFLRQSVPYFKLHGTLDHIADEKLPLILTPDQYINNRAGREHLFDHLKEFAYSYTILFVGFSFADQDIRAVLNQIGSNDTKPRSYLIGPNIKPAEASLWEGKKITSIITSFGEFMDEINRRIPKPLRISLSNENSLTNPIFSSFSVSIEEKKPSDRLLTFIDQDIDFVHRAISSPNTDPKAFYKGYFENWDPIVRNLDVNRSLKDGILSEVFLDEEDLLSTNSKFYILKGHAGSGKSVLLKRIAFEASTSFDLFCIFLKSNSQIAYDQLYELYTFVKSRIFVFIDQVAGHISSIEKIIERSKKDKIPITIIGCERINVWNTDCDQLEKLVEEDYHLKFLNEKEIRELIVLLTRYDSLGYLKQKSIDEQIQALREKADRELLVALHESTHGKPFHEIIENEYNSINDPSAKSLYLTVCILHRLGSYARAGLISRVHGINFDEFKKKFFIPLEYIIFSNYDSKINDYVYTTRHPQIAEMVFETILKNRQEKYDEYVRILTNINIDYDSDKNAFIAMTNATELLALFDDPLKIRNLYEIAEEKSINNPKLFQQQAIFEMKRANGNFNLAEEFLHKAYNESPSDPVIAHSFAEFAFRKAEKATHKLEIFKLLDESKDICLKLIKKYQKDSHHYHTLLKVELSRLEYIADHADGPTIERIVKEIEKYLSEAKQIFPDQPFLLEMEAKFNTLLNNIPEAQKALEKAFEINKSNPYICLRLANFYESQGDINRAIAVCSDTLKISANERDVNFKIGILLCKLENPNYTEIQHYFRKSFTIGDTRYLSQLWYARISFLLKEYQTAKEIFGQIGQANVPPEFKYKPRGIIKVNGREVIFTGRIIRKEVNFGLIRRDDFGDVVSFNRVTEDALWDKLHISQLVSFKLAFNFKGPLAIEISEFH